ncbi:MAG: PQQ-binding-like beta-propeller repeat protein, partial [Pirellulales bacterium]
AGPQQRSLLGVLKEALEGEEEKRRRAEAARREAARRQAMLQAQIMQAQRAAQMGRFAPPWVFTPNGPMANVPAEASLKTDTDLDRLLNRADEFAADGRFDLAVVLWQEVLDKSTDTVITRDQWLQKTSEHEYRRYRAVTEAVERSLAELPETGLRVYRASADGEAKAILAAGQPDGERPGRDREQALSEVVRRFFLSSHGDQAAFELACLQLERHEYIGASRLFGKLLADYPDSDVARHQVVRRLAVANARIGDRQSAEELLAELEESASAPSLPGGDGPSWDPVSLVRRDVEQSAAQPPLSEPAGSWPMHLGGPGRAGHMKATSWQEGESALTELWANELGAKLPQESKTAADAELPSRVRTRSGRQIRQVVRLNDGRVLVVNAEHAVFLNGQISLAGGQAISALPSTETVIERWKRAGWNPAGGLLLDGGHIYLKARDRLLCCDAATGETLWKGRPNEHPVHPLARAYLAVPQDDRNSQPQLASTEELLWFGDRVRQAMSLVGDLVLSVEGSSPQAEAPQPAHRAVPGPFGGVVLAGGPTVAAATQSNAICAYDRRNGKLRWHRSALAENAEPGTAATFLAAPIPYANLLLVPVLRNGQLWLTALDAPDGTTLWKTFLCEAPCGARSPFSPVGSAVDGGEVYVASGAGAVFALDALNGALRWVATYPRCVQGQLAAYSQIRLPGRPPAPATFAEDVAIPRGRQLLVMASDHDRLMGLDRRTGELLWESPVDPGGEGETASRYCLGVLGEGLHVAGRNRVRRYDATGGRLVWEAEIEDSLARGLLTEAAIYMPLAASVVRLDVTTGERLGRVPVVLPSDQPVGNLYCTGEGLLAVGMGRVYALGASRAYLDELAERIEAGDGRAQLRRMRFRSRSDDMDGAVADLRGAYDLLLAAEDPAANDALDEAIADLGLSTDRPLVALELLGKSAAVGGGEPPADETVEMSEAWKRRSTLLYEALKSVHKEKLKGTASLILGVGPLCASDRLLTAARRAMETTVEADDEAPLREALAHDDPQVQALGAVGLTLVLRERSAPEVKEMLASDEPYAQLTAAAALANQGDRDALPVLGALLDSAELSVRSRSVQVLRALTGEYFSFLPHAPADDRAQAAAQWRAWVASQESTVDLSHPITEADLTSGRTLLTCHLTGEVIEIDAHGRITWQEDLPGAWECQALPNGHRLACSCTHPVIIEYDDWGDEVSRLVVGDKPFSVQRLANGNTLVACYAGRIQEIAPDNRVIAEFEMAKYPVDADRLANGNTLICLKSTNRVVEVDGAGN